MYQPSYPQHSPPSYPQQYQQPQPVAFPTPQAQQPQNANMPTYYIPNTHSSRSRSRSRSQSQSYYPSGQVYGNTLYPTTTGHRSSSHSRHGHSASYGGYPSSGGYQSGHSSPGHSSSHYYGDSGRRRHNSTSGGYSGGYHAPQQYSAPVYSSGHRRSQSTSRYQEPRVIDLRHHSSDRHRNYQYAQPSLSDRLRNFFSSGPSQHHSGHRSEYVDRTGRPCDRHGRPILRV